MPKVSVIVPVYGVERYIERCARSLFMQTLDEIEFVFIDDCTQDCSIEILKSVIEEFRLRFAEKKNEVRIVRMPTNSGQAAVRRHGIQLAKGGYIIHCDSDDWVDVDMYRIMYEKAISEQSDIVVCNYTETDGNDYIKPRINPSFKDKQDFLGKIISHEISPCVWNKLVKRSLYFKNSIVYPNGNMGEDIALMIQLVFYSSKITPVENCLYNYYVNLKSISRLKDKEACIRKWNQIKLNTDIILKFLSEHNLLEIYSKQILLMKEQSRDNNLLPAVFDSYIRKLWLESYPETHKQRLFSRFFSLKLAFRYLSVYFRLYKYINKVRTNS